MPRIHRGVAAGAALVMAYHLAARAVRDALFLSRLDARELPLMMAAAAVVGMAAALSATAWTARHGSRRFVPAAFVLSAVLTLLEWGLIAARPPLGAVAFFLHVAAFGPVLVSGLWSTMLDTLDPRTMRAMLGRIAAIATVGGLAGLVVANALGTWFGITAVLPALAALNLACAAITARAGPPQRVAAGENLSLVRAWSTLRGEPHLANLALLVVLAAVSGGIVDLLFKLHANARVAGHSLGLLRIFLGYYGAVALGTFLLQLAFQRLAASRDWILRTVAPLPVVVLTGGVAASAFSAAWLLPVLRGAEAVLHGSIFRGGYELLYGALPPARKLAVRSLIDVGCDRLGDLLAQGIVLFVLVSLPVMVEPTLLLLAAAVAAASLLVVLRLRRGHEEALADTLRLSARFSALQFATGAPSATGADDESAPPPPPLPEPAFVPAPAPRDVPVLAPAEIPAAIRRLGVADEAAAAADALVLVAEEHPGQLVDALLDAREDLVVRRAIPGILERCPSPRAVEGLVHGLHDVQFEMRARCSAALSRLRERGFARLDAPAAFAAVRWELQQNRIHALDPAAHKGTSRLDTFLAGRAVASLEHVFHVLSLVYPREPLLQALDGLRGTDPGLRGTALEYLDEILPPDLAGELEPVLAAARGAAARA